MPAWEYRTIELDATGGPDVATRNRRRADNGELPESIVTWIEKPLNELGSFGWELIAIMPNSKGSCIGILKRTIETR